MTKYNLGFLSILLISACSVQQQDASSPIANSDTPHQLFNKSTTLCSPLQDETDNALNERGGLQGKLYYLEPHMPRFTTVEDYTRAVDTGTTVFFNDVNVPTRMFTRGFPAADGSLLMANGEVLTEWFHLYVESQIKLADEDATGYYQFAMIADDGATMEIQPDGAYQMHVNNDGTHSSRFACATSALFLSPETRIPTRIKYYQGPRTEIALMVLMRKIPSASVPADPLCGATGQNLFFEYRNNPSTPQQAYQDLLARGWKPLHANNFVLPGKERVNPCNTGTNWE